MNLFLKFDLNNIKEQLEQLKQKKFQEPSIVGAIYYQSRLLSKNISPVLLTKEKNEDDLKGLLYIYLDYWHRAEKYNTQIPTSRIANEDEFKVQLDRLYEFILNQFL